VHCYFAAVKSKFFHIAHIVHETSNLVLQSAETNLFAVQNDPSVGMEFPTFQSITFMLWFKDK